jgi:TPR repeat protein
MAVKWFVKAARQGNKTAQHNLGVHYAATEAKEEAAAAAAEDAAEDAKDTPA